MLKEKRYAFPPVKAELAGTFFSILIGFSLEAGTSKYDASGNHCYHSEPYRLEGNGLCHDYIDNDGQCSL